MNNILTTLDHELKRLYKIEARYEWLKTHARTIEWYEEDEHDDIFTNTKRPALDRNVDNAIERMRIRKELISRILDTNTRYNDIAIWAVNNLPSELLPYAHIHTSDINAYLAFSQFNTNNVVCRLVMYEESLTFTYEYKNSNKHMNIPWNTKEWPHEILMLLKLIKTQE